MDSFFLCPAVRCMSADDFRSVKFYHGAVGYVLGLPRLSMAWRVVHFRGPDTNCRG